MRKRRTTPTPRPATTDQRRRQLVLDEVGHLLATAWIVGGELAQPDPHWLLDRDVSPEAVRHAAATLAARCDAFINQLRNGPIDDHLYELARLMAAGREFDNLLGIGAVAAQEALAHRRVARRGAVATEKKYQREREERCVEVCAEYRRLRDEERLAGHRLMAKLAEHFRFSVKHGYKVLRQCHCQPAK